MPLESSPSPAHSVWRPIVSRAVWLGIVAGIVEGAIPLVQKFEFERMRIHTSPNVLWMAPLAEAMLFLAVGVLLAAGLAVVMRRKPERIVAIASAVLAALAVWSVALMYPQLYDWAAWILAAGAGVQLGRAASGASFDRLVTRTLMPLGVLVAIVAAGMLLVPRWREHRAITELSAARAGAPNVLLLILDTVRAQSLELYGAARATTPHLEGIAADGATFDYAISTAPWTLPSHASIFTGRYPHELTADWLTPLDDSTPTLAESLARHGYATAGFAGNYMVSYEVGLARGFHHYEDYRVSFPQLALSSAILRKAIYTPRLRRLVGRYDSANRKRAPVVNGELLRWLDHRPSRPFFAFVNYMDAHEMYNPPAPFRTRFGPDTARRNELVRYGLGGVGFRSGKSKMTSPQVQAELDAYEESIAYLDNQIGALMDSLATRGLLDQTVVIVTSDHGESFGEHQRWEHASSLYPQQLHVPLIIRAPGRVPAGESIPEFVTLRDLPATILAMGPGTEDLPGQSLTRFWDAGGIGTQRPASPLLATITNGFWKESSKPTVRQGMRSIVVNGHEVIEDVIAPASFELFDLRRDPRGEIDLAHDSASRDVLSTGRALLRPITWRSQQRGIARQAGEIGTPQQ